MPALTSPFLNAELKRAAKPPIATERVIDTRVLAAQASGGLTLDDLCSRYGLDRSHRTQHGALLDAEPLAAVYVEVTTIRLAALQLEPIATAKVMRYAATNREKAGSTIAAAGDCKRSQRASDLRADARQYSDLMRLFRSMGQRRLT
jgi:DNA polymerase III subunit epsilon